MCFGAAVIAISGFHINSRVGIVLMRSDMVIVIVPIVSLTLESVSDFVSVLRSI